MAGVWKNVWEGVEGIEFGREPYMWKLYEMLLGDYDFKGKKVIEIGCGTGINTVLMGIRGARITLLDSSRKALGIAKDVLDRYSQSAELVYGNALDYDFEGEFDISHSEGVIEHFLGEERQGIVNSHADALRRGGKTVIIVPNMKCVPYRIGKSMAERTGTWIHGGEYPYSSRELRTRLRRAGMETEKEMGGELMFSLGWLLSPLWLGGGSILKKSIEQPASKKMVRINYNNPLANRWGRVIASVARKP